MYFRKQKGLTLVEILLVIAVIGVLSTIVIIAINPVRQLNQARDANRLAATESLKNALFQYNLDNESYPPGLTTDLQDVCRPGGSTGCIDLETYLVPLYIAEIPVDEEASGDVSGYQVGLDGENNNRLQVGSIFYGLANAVPTGTIQIDNSANVSTLTNYQVAITLPYSSNFATDFSDVRFQNSSGQELDFWLESFTDSVEALFWVEVDSIPGGGITEIEYVYGNTSGFTTSSSVSSVFIPDQIYVETRRCTDSSICDLTANNTEFTQIINSDFTLDGSGYVLAIDLGDNPYGSDDDYFMRYRYLFVPQSTDTYAFRTSSDDASEMYLNSEGDTHTGGQVLAHLYAGWANDVNCAQGSSNSAGFTSGQPEWIEYRTTQGDGGQHSYACMQVGSGSMQPISVSNFPGQIFSRNVAEVEPVVTVSGLTSGGASVVEDQLYASFDAGDAVSYPGSGTVWTDTSPNAFSATIASGVQFVSDDGGKFRFEGASDDYAVIPYDPSMDLGQNWSLEAVVYIDTPNSDPREDPIIWKIANPGSHQDQYYLGWNGPGFRAGFERSSDDNDYLAAVSGLANQSWYHVVATYDDDFLRMYINGNLITANQIGSHVAYTGTEDLYIGALEHSGHTPRDNFDGDIAIARIYNKALNDSEVNQNFEAVRSRFGL